MLPSYLYISILHGLRFPHQLRKGSCSLTSICTLLLLYIIFLGQLIGFVAAATTAFNLLEISKSTPTAVTRSRVSVLCFQQPVLYLPLNVPGSSKFFKWNFPLSLFPRSATTWPPAKWPLSFPLTLTFPFNQSPKPVHSACRISPRLSLLPITAPITLFQVCFSSLLFLMTTLAS